MIVNTVAMGQLRALLRSHEAENQLRAALGGLPSVALEVLQGALSDNLAQLVAAPRPGAVLLDLDLGDSAQLLVFRKLVGSELAGVPVIVTSPAAGVEELRQLMRLHIAEYLPQPMVSADVITAISHALRRSHATDAHGRHLCKVFSLVRRSGGMGGTFLAIQTALSLLGRNRKGSKAHVCLVDLNFQSAVSATYLDVDANLDLIEIARSPDRLDAHLLHAMVSHHRSGLDVIAPPPAPIELESVTPEAVTKLLDVVCEHYDYVVVDLPPAWTRWTIDVIGGSDVVLLVMQLSVAAVQQARALIEKLTAEGVAPETINLVVNRYRRKFWGSGVQLSSAQEALGRKVDFLIADDPDLVSKALDHGQTLSEIRPRSAIEKQVTNMVDHLVARLSPPAPAAGAGRADRSPARS